MAIGCATPLLRCVQRGQGQQHHPRHGRVLPDPSRGPATWLALNSLYVARTYNNLMARPSAIVDWSRPATNQPREVSPIRFPRLWRNTRGES